MKYLLLVIYLFSSSVMAGHCSAGASHDDEHESDHSRSEMKKDSKVKKDSDAEETEAKEDSDSEA